MIVRRMEASDVEFAFACTSAEGWQSETRGSFEGFLAHDPGGCFVAEHDAKRIGICIATQYRNNGFVGELIVVEGMRGRGYGRKLLEHTIRYLHSRGVRNIFLDGDLDAVPIYEKAGFRKVCKSLRFVGRIEGQSHKLVREAGPQDVEAICKIDLDLFGEDRSFFLRRRLSLSPHRCFVYDVDGQVLGYIMARSGVGVVSVGPWAVLDAMESPRVLLEHLACEVEGELMRIGVLETNSKAVETIQSFRSLESQVPCWRMALGPSERLGMNAELYAIGAPAKG